MRTNSLLADFENIETSFNPIKEIRQFIKDNYDFKGPLQISKEPNENGKYEVSCSDARVQNFYISFLTNNLFVWTNIKNNFNCDFCHFLTSLEGAPEKVGGSFSCAHCTSLTSLKGAPESVGGSFSCSQCKSLTSLEGAPKEVGSDFYCNMCRSLISLKGAPKKIDGNFNCPNCISLTSLEGAPKKIRNGLNCQWCLSLTSLEGAPKEIYSIRCYGGAREFTNAEITKITNSKVLIYEY